jgi:hypothetical protein
MAPRTAVPFRVSGKIELAADRVIGLHRPLDPPAAGVCIELQLGGPVVETPARYFLAAHLAMRSVSAQFLLTVLALSTSRRQESWC